MMAIEHLIREIVDDAQRLVILGAGSVLRADDAAGMYIIEKLQGRFAPEQYPELLFCPGETAPENYSGKIKAFRPTHLLVIDAADVGQEPGALVEIQPEDVGGPTFCTHMLPLRVMLDYLARQTGAKVTLLGIQYQSLAFDGEMSPPVLQAADRLFAALESRIRARFGERTGG